MNARGRSGNYLKNYNNKLVAKLLLDNKYSRIEISKKIKLSHTALALIMERLIQRDLVKEVKNDEKFVRRKGGQHIRYTINNERAMFLCVNLQHEYECFVVCDLVGNEVLREKLNVGKVSNGVATDILVKIKDKLKTFNIREADIQMVSVAISGQLNIETGDVIFSSKVDKDVNLKKIFEKEFVNADVQIKNDVECCCLASMLSEEFNYSEDCLLFLYVGAGLGCCLTYNKKVVKNSIGFGGEIGGERISENMTLSNAWENEDFLNYCKKITNNPELNTEEALLLAESNAACREKLDRQAKYLAQTISNFTYTVGCAKIIFSGKILRYPTYFFDKVKEYLKIYVRVPGFEYEFMYTQFVDALSGQKYLSRDKLIEKLIEE